MERDRERIGPARPEDRPRGERTSPRTRPSVPVPSTRRSVPIPRTRRTDPGDSGSTEIGPTHPGQGALVDGARSSRYHVNPDSHGDRRRKRSGARGPQPGAAPPAGQPVRGRSRAARGTRARRRRLGDRAGPRGGGARRQRRGARALPARRAQRPDPPHPRPLRQPNRRGRARPSWHWLLRGAVERELHSLPWRAAQPGAHVVRAALFMLYGNANAGVMCPVSMTYAAVPALRDGAPELAAEWEPRLTLPDYERGALAGMAMTERQGGSDVRANITRAEPVGDDVYELHGHKWFCSYPPCDVFLVPAQTPGGLSCFLVERGAGMEFQRLKDKLGTRSLPSSEVEFHGAQGRLVGEEGRGVPAIIRMVNHTRLDCLLGATTSLRRGTVEAIHHARHRAAFGALLVDQPAMRNVLADLAIESEAATVAALRVARAYDSDAEAALPSVRHRGHEVLGVQARGAARGRGARVPGRQRLRRGLRAAAAVPGRAVELDLGGLGERGRARRPARVGQGARGAAGLPGRVLSWRRVPTRGSTPTWTVCAFGGVRGVRRPRSRNSRRAGWSRIWPWRFRRRCSCGSHRRRSPTHSVRPGWPAASGRVYGTLPSGVDAAAIVDRALPA